MRTPRGVTGDLIVAAAATAAVVAIRFGLDPWLSSMQPFAPGFVAVAAVVWYRGDRAAAATALACYLSSTFFFVEPRGHLSLSRASDIAALVTNLTSSALIIVIGHKARRARESGDRFRAAQEVSLHPFTILRAVRDGGQIVDFEWTYVNDAAAEALKASPAELVGQRLLVRLPGNRAELFPRYCRVVETGHGHDVEVAYDADGVSGWFRNMAVRLGDGVAVSFLDVTPEKQRQRDLAQRDAMKDRFLAMLAHELRQPLNAVTMAAQALQRDVVTRESAVALLQRQVAQLARLVDDLNDLTRIAEGRLTVERRRFDLREPLGLAVEACDEVLRHTGRTLLYESPAEPLWVEGDAARIRQVFSNLLTNAEQATRDGGLIAVEAGRAGTGVRVRVRDTGRGLAPEILPHLFTLFAEGTGVSGRLGIGLALVKRITDLHGGTVQVSSEGEGRGAEFVLELPAAVAPSVEDTARPSQPTVEVRHAAPPRS